MIRPAKTEPGEDAGSPNSSRYWGDRGRRPGGVFEAAGSRRNLRGGALPRPGPPAIGRALALDIHPLGRKPLGHVVLVDDAADVLGARGALVRGHGERLVQGLGLALHVERVDREREGAELLV